MCILSLIISLIFGFKLLVGPPKCPTCMSTLVIQSDEVSTPAPEPLERIPEKARETFEKIHDKAKPEVQKEIPNEPQLPHSSSQSSIGK